MSEPLKNRYSPTFVKEVAAVFNTVSPEFNAKKFLAFVLDDKWEGRELRDRTRHLTAGLSLCLSDDYAQSVQWICEASKQIKGGLFGFFLPDYVSDHGLAHWEVSMDALAILTEHSTSEFAIRPFLDAEFDKGMKQLHLWTKSANKHHRRLASEGSRSRLPWAKKVQALDDHPALVMELLSKMMEDESEYVRRSVANNLNDISKAEPLLVKTHCAKWKGKSEATDKLIKHGLRTLLKQGDREALDLIGISDAKGVKVCSFTCQPEVSIGNQFSFKAMIENAKSPQPLRIEYAIHYQKKLGTRSKKVFHWSLADWKSGQQKTLAKNQSFKDMTTRVHYPGKHTLEVIVNGEVLASLNFHVKK
jgi:3-methyladenine DNA glycosylase AlkC